MSLRPSLGKAASGSSGARNSSPLASASPSRSCACQRGARGDEEVDRFSRELSLVAALHHPHIVRLIDSGALPDGAPFMVLEYLRGDTLAEHIARGPLPPRVALRLMTHTLEALRHAHQHGVIHRDLKPQNIMVTGDDRPSAVVLDFGVSALTSTARAPDYKSLTAAHQLIGTPAYMAPEQVDQRGDLTPAADLYAWGLVLLECLTGQPAAEGDSLMATLLWQMSAAPIHIPDALVGSPLGDLIAKAVAKPLSARYADADALLHDLEALDLNALPTSLTSAHPPRAADRQALDQADTASLDAAQVIGPQVAAAEPTRTTDHLMSHAPPSLSQQPPTANLPDHVSKKRPSTVAIIGALGLCAALIWALWPLQTPQQRAPAQQHSADADAAPDVIAAAPDVIAAAPDVIAAAPDVIAAALDAPPPAPAGMVWIPPGIATVGLGDPHAAVFMRLCEETYQGRVDCAGDVLKDETPPHRLRFSEGFFMDKVEVSVVRYRACVMAGFCTPPRTRPGTCDASQMTWDMPSGDDLPINCIDWHQADRFCAWQEGRLPFEDEWEYAARGATARPFPWGDDMPGCVLAALDGERCRLDKPSPVGSWPLDISPFGVLDMGGNLTEWTASEHDTYPPDGPVPALRRAPAAPTSSYRIRRGGSWMVPALGARMTIRLPTEKDATLAAAGFRCARNAP
jgi:formylglycine-generating enzyme required for sulfatase activity/serine/threonine protein kinase